METKAKHFAMGYHAGQVRKYTGEPYINHPAAVVQLVRSVEHTEAMICAAWLHDVVEDTSAQLLDVFNLFGEDVARLVSDLTDVSRLSDGNRATRKAIDLMHTAQAVPQAKTIKLADLIENTRSIVDRDPSFAKVYLREKAKLLHVLRDGDPALWKMVFDSIPEEYRLEVRLGERK